MNVYGLFDPINNNFFYVGVSADLKRRLLGHMSSTDKNLEKVDIIKKIKEKKRRPEIKILEVVPDYQLENILEIEMKWILALKAQGHPLTNKALNGAGCRPTNNPKKAVSLYIEEDVISSFGGAEKFKNILYNYIKNYEE